MRGRRRRRVRRRGQASFTAQSNPRPAPPDFSPRIATAPRDVLMKATGLSTSDRPKKDRLPKNN
jgi:hypothetical protein